MDDQRFASGYLLAKHLIVVDDLAHNSIVVGADVSHAKVLASTMASDDLDAVLTEHDRAPNAH